MSLPGAAVDRVGAGVAGDDVVAGEAADDVAPAEAVDRVGPAVPVSVLRRVGADDVLRERRRGERERAEQLSGPADADVFGHINSFARSVQDGVTE